MSARPPVAFIIMAHYDPAKIRRLIATLENADVFLHCDARTPTAILEQMVQAGASNVHLVPRYRSKLSCFSLMAAELTALKVALSTSDAEHIVVLSGTCYPLLSLADLNDDLAGWRGRSRLQLNPIPYPAWNSFLRHDGGMWRFRTRFLGHGDDLIMIRGLPIPLGRRSIPPELELYASAEWKIYARTHAQVLVETLERLPEQLEYWRRVFNADEPCAASILKSPALVGELSDNVINDYPWFIKWPEQRSPHPTWLTAADFDAMATARSADGKLFARKINSQASDLLDRIDGELRL
jgi:Core-2/I-Branching enzyme